MSADDVLRIANLKAHYCATADSCTHDPDAARKAFGALFTEDAVADYGYGEIAGIPNIAEFLASSIADDSQWMVHMLSSPRIIVDGNSATGDWTILIHSKRKDGTMMQVIGRYSDAYALMPEGWRIARVQFRHLA